MPDAGPYRVKTEHGVKVVDGPGVTLFYKGESASEEADHACWCFNLAHRAALQRAQGVVEALRRVVDAHHGVYTDCKPLWLYVAEAALADYDKGVQDA